MTTDTALPPPSAPPRRSYRPLLLITVLAFIAGLSVMGWALSRWDAGRNWLFGTPAPQAVPPISYTAQPAQPAIVARPMLQPDERMALLESRLSRIEARGFSSGDNARAEGLLIAFAARRALDRGLQLGYLEGLLSEHFGETQPRAVATIIAAARQPATREQLTTQLEALAPALGTAPPDQGWWEATRQSLGGLFVVREEGEAPPDPQSRVALAERHIAGGRVDLALAEIARLPNRNQAVAWMDSARRYIEAHRALDLLEAAAITADRGTN